MSPVYVEWTHVGPESVWGHGTGFFFSLFKAPLDRLSFDAVARENPWKLGVVIEFLDRENYTGIVLGQDGSVFAFEMRNGSATWWPKGELRQGPPPSPVSVDVVAASEESRVTFAGETFAFPRLFPARMGLAVDNGSVDFREIQWSVSSL